MQDFISCEHPGPQQGPRFSWASNPAVANRGRRVEVACVTFSKLAGLVIWAWVARSPRVRLACQRVRQDDPISPLADHRRDLMLDQRPNRSDRQSSLQTVRPTRSTELSGPAAAPKRPTSSVRCRTPLQRRGLPRLQHSLSASRLLPFPLKVVFANSFLEDRLRCTSYT